MCRLPQTSVEPQITATLFYKLPAQSVYFFIVFLFIQQEMMFVYASRNSFLFTLRRPDWNSELAVFILVDHMYPLPTLSTLTSGQWFTFLLAFDYFQMKNTNCVNFSLLTNLSKYLQILLAMLTTYLNIGFVFITTREYCKRNSSQMQTNILLSLIVDHIWKRIYELFFALN